MIAISPLEFGNKELRVLRAVFAKLNLSLSKRCPENKACALCEYNRLCAFVRDAFIVCDKEIKRRK